MEVIDYYSALSGTRHNATYAELRIRNARSPGRISGSRIEHSGGFIPNYGLDGNPN